MNKTNTLGEPLLKEIQVTDLSERVKSTLVTEKPHKRIIEKILLIFVILFLCSIAILLGLAVTKVDQLKTVSKNGVQTLLNEVHHLNPLQIVVRLQSIASSLQNLEGQVEKLSSQDEFQVTYTTPIKDQGLRPNSWVFATISLLEQQYRNQGLRDGYLNSTAYLTFSEQAYHSWLLQYCEKNENLQAPLCVGGNLVSFEDGFVHYLYELRSELNKVILPSVACPYINDPLGDLTYCPDFKNRLASNPIIFQTINMQVSYQINEMKKMICEGTGRSPTLTMNIPLTSFYTPCTLNANSSVFFDFPCVNDICQHCPSDKYHSDCCNVHILPGFTHHGEFFTHFYTGRMMGRYSMLVMGYSSNYVTFTGQIGGFIVKNSWGIARGGHSIDYFMNKLSYDDEMSVCPNSFSPGNWYQCGISVSLPYYEQPYNLETSFNNCKSHSTIASAKNQFRPLKLHCKPTPQFLDFSFCNNDVNVYTYYLLNSTQVLYDEYIYEMCFLEYNIDTEEYRDLCIGPFFLDLFSSIFIPSPDNNYPTSPDQCGYFFVPYSFLSKSVNPSMLDIIIEFDPSSYIVNEGIYTQYNYSFLRLSMREEIPMKEFGHWPVPYHI